MGGLSLVSAVKAVGSATKSFVADPVITINNLMTKVNNLITYVKDSRERAILDLWKIRLERWHEDAEQRRKAGLEPDMTTYKDIMTMVGVGVAPEPKGYNFY